MNSFASFLDSVKTATHITLLAHKDPDFDTLSACAALGLIAKKFDCSIELIIPNTEPVTLSYFPFPVQSGFFTKTPDLIVICDTSSINRVFFPQEFKNIPIALFDHHQGGDIAATLRFVDNKAPSCCDLIFEIIHSYDKNLITSEIAQLLFDGLVADTLSFRTSGVLPTTFSRAAQLLECGAHPLISHQRLTAKQTPADFIFKAQLMSRVNIDHQKSCAYLSVTEQELQAANRTKGTLEGIGNEFIANMSIDTSILTYTLNSGKTKVSLRSNTINVYEIAKNNGGGGHICAAGFETNKPAHVIVDELLNVLSAS
jgi:phosphoesterase RecJ-like protein